MIEIINAHLTYPSGNIGFSEVSFNLNCGECKAVIGKTGSGKSSLVSSINGLLKLTDGDIRVEGLSVKDKKNLREIRKNIGLCMQYPEYQLFAETVYDDIAFGPRNFGVKEEEIKELVKDAMDKVGLDESYKNRSPFGLSGGEKRKAALAGVISINPKYILLDEPTAGLDPNSREVFLNVFSELKKEGTGILMVSHMPDEVARLADGIIVMQNGKLIREGSPSEIYSNFDFLEKYNLKPPIITDFMHSLRLSGRDVRCDIFTVEDAAREVERCLR